MTPDHPTFRFLTPRNLLAMMAGLCLYAGIVLHNPHLVFIGAASLGALVTSWLTARKLLQDISVERTHTTRTFENQTVTITVRLHTDSPRSQPLVLVEDTFPPGTPFRMRHLIERPLEKDTDVTMTFEGECVHKRGLYTLGPVRLEAWDPLGLTRRELFVEEFTPMLVYPAAPELHEFEVLADGTLKHIGMEARPRPGNSTEFIGLREYRVGDSPSTIHWRSTARTGELVVKEFQEDLTTDVAVFLDLGRQGLTGLGDQTSVEYAVKAASGIARRAVALAHRVEVFAVGAEVEHIPAGAGNRQLLMVLDRLSFLKPEAESDFFGAVSWYTPLLKPGSTAVMIVSLTLIDAETMRPILAALRRRQVLPVVVLIDDRAFIKLFVEQEIRHGEAMSLEDTARFLILEGARVHVVTKAKSPRQALVQGLDREYMTEAGEADEYAANAR